MILNEKFYSHNSRGVYKMSANVHISVMYCHVFHYQRITAQLDLYLIRYK